MIPIGNIVYAYRACAIRSGRAGGCAAGAIAPVTADCGISDRGMRGIMHGDGYSGSPPAALAGARPIQIANVHWNWR